MAEAAAYTVHVTGSTSKLLEVDLVVNESLANADFTIGEGSAPFVKDLRVKANGSPAKFHFRNGRWTIPACKKGRCEIHYRFDFQGAAKQLDDPEKIAARA